MRTPLGPRTARHIAPLMILAALACGSGEDASSTAAPAVTLAAAPVAESAPEIEFSQVTDMDVDSRGQIYAGDALNEIVVLTPDGKLVRRFGGLGGGPGEFQAVSTVYLLPDDSLYVYDGYGQRATIYQPHSARVAYTVRFPQPGFAFPVNVEPRPGGYMLAHFRRINGDVPIAGQKQDDVIRVLARDGSIRADSVVTVLEPAVVEIRSERMTGFFFPLFARQTLVRWGLDGRIYTLWTDSARVSIHGPDGRARGGFDARLPFPRQPLTDATLDSVWQMNADGGFDRRTFTQAFRSRWQTWPLVQDMLVDDQSRVWIQPVTQGPTSAWLAFDSAGEQVATLSLPRAVRPRLIRGDRMYGIRTDSLDVETVVVFRLTPSSTRTPDRP